MELVIIRCLVEFKHARITILILTLMLMLLIYFVCLYKMFVKHENAYQRIDKFEKPILWAPKLINTQ